MASHFKGLGIMGLLGDIIGDVVGGIGSIIGGKSNSKAIDRATQVQQQSAREAINEVRRQYDTTRADNEVGRQLGDGAKSALYALYGLGQYAPRQATPQPTSQPSLANLFNGSFGFGGGEISPRLDSIVSNLATPAPRAASTLAGGINLPEDAPRGLGVFQESPDYQFRLSEGLKAIDRGAGARGLLGSGRRLKDLARFGSNLASQEYGNFTNRLLALSGLGQAANDSNAAFGSRASESVANIASNRGSSLSNLAIARGTNNSNTINSVFNAGGSILGSIFK